MSNQTKMLMDLCYGISFPTDWHSIMGPFRSRLPSLNSSLAFLSQTYSWCGLRVLVNYLLTPCCCTVVWASGFGSVTQVLEVSVIGGTYAYPVGCLGVSRFAYCLWGPYFHRYRSPTLPKLFWSGDAYFGNQDSTYISYLHVFLVQTL